MKKIKTVDINNEFVSNYSITHYPSGIVSILINTVERWVGFGRRNDNHYVFSNGDDENAPEFSLIIPENIFKLDGKYICSERQNKDQICFYFIPYSLLDINVFHKTNSQTIFPIGERSILKFKVNRTTEENLFSLYEKALKAIESAEEEVLFLKYDSITYKIDLENWLKSLYNNTYAFVCTEHGFRNCYCGNRDDDPIQTKVILDSDLKPEEKLIDVLEKYCTKEENYPNQFCYKDNFKLTLSDNEVYLRDIENNYTINIFDNSEKLIMFLESLN